jgi:hypothetical protein
MKREQNDNKSGDFKLEYYKYILQQLQFLNENTHKYLALFQTLATAVIGGGVLIFISWRQVNIDAGTAKVGINGLLWLFIILGVFVVFSIISNVLSWHDYRHEEVKLLKREVGTEFRKAPKWRNMYRWNETYLLIFIVVVIIVVIIFVKGQVLPIIK